MWSSGVRALTTVTLGDSPQCGGLALLGLLGAAWALLEKGKLREEGSPGPKLCSAEGGEELSQSKEPGGQTAAVWSPEEPALGCGWGLQGRVKLAPI